MVITERGTKQRSVSTVVVLLVPGCTSMPPDSACIAVAPAVKLQFDCECK